LEKVMTKDDMINERIDLNQRIDVQQQYVTDLIVARSTRKMLEAHTRLVIMMVNAGLLDRHIRDYDE